MEKQEKIYKVDSPKSHENTPEYYTQKAAMTRRRKTMLRQKLGIKPKTKPIQQLNEDLIKVGNKVVLLEKGLQKLRSKAPPRGLNEILLEKLSYYTYDSNRTNAEMIVDRLLNEAIVKRNLFAIRDIFDRTLGKVTDKHQLDVKVPIQLVFAPFDDRKPLPPGGQVVTVEARELLDAASAKPNPEDSAVHADFSENAGQ